METIRLVVDSRDRERDRYPSPTDFSVQLPVWIEGLVCAGLRSYVVPMTRGVVWEGNRGFRVGVDWERTGAGLRWYDVRLPPSLFPSDRALAALIQRALTEALGVDLGVLGEGAQTAPDARYAFRVELDAATRGLSIALNEVWDAHPENTLDSETEEVSRHYEFGSLPIRLDLTGRPDAARLLGLDAGVVVAAAEVAHRLHPEDETLRPVPLHAVRSVRACDMDVDYLSVHIKEVPGAAAAGPSSGAIALIPGTRKQSLLYNKYTSGRDTPFDRAYANPLPRITRLTVRILDPEGRVYDSRDRDVVLDLEFLCARGAGCGGGGLPARL